MYVLYSIVLAVGFLLMLPLFWLRREKYAAGFKQRLGNYPPFEHNGRKVIWLHCVSVGETNAARPLVDALLENFPDHRFVFSTTTKTGQDLAQKIFAEKADAIVYFPFDFKFSVRRALRNYKPSLVLLMETEIWPRFIREAKRNGAKIAIVNGRLSERSFRRYLKVRLFIKCILAYVDRALMQGSNDANRLISLGISAAKVNVTGNLKFDLALETSENELTRDLRTRFGIGKERPVILAASTHEPEERIVLEGFFQVSLDNPDIRPRLFIAPRHPERFEDVASVICQVGSTSDDEWHDYEFARRSAVPSETDKTADVILLDSIGELRAVYPLAEIVFVGGSLIPHGGQSILEPAAAGKAIVTGPYTENFGAVIKEFLSHEAMIQLFEPPNEFYFPDMLRQAFTNLLKHENKRGDLGANAAVVLAANRGATRKTIEYLRTLVSPEKLKVKSKN